MNRIFPAGIALLALAACDTPPPATNVTAFNGDSVTIEARSATNTPHITARAQEVCSAAGQRAYYGSSRRVTEGTGGTPTHAHLFLCLD